VTGTVFAVAIVFAILFIVMRSMGYYRGRFSVADAETSTGAAAWRPAAIGAGAGVLVLFLSALLFIGVTRWEWFGRPEPRAPVVAVPAKESPPSVLGGIGSTPSPPPTNATPSASPSP
jgi:hypothetical protein